MTDYQIWSAILTVVGLYGFYLTGKKIWWGWYVNIANQVVWLGYAIFTQQWPFIIGVIAYTFIFTKNAIAWTKEHRTKDDPLDAFDPGRNRIAMSSMAVDSFPPETPRSHIRQLDTNQPICEIPKDRLLGFVKIDPSDTAMSCPDCSLRIDVENRKPMFPRKRGSW